MNKSQNDVVLDNEKIVNDKLIHIRSLLIDNIDLTRIMPSVCEYEPNDPWYINSDNPEIVTHCIDLGWNGEWRIDFRTPFYRWLLDTL